MWSVPGQWLDGKDRVSERQKKARNINSQQIQHNQGRMASTCPRESSRSGREGSKTGR